METLAASPPPGGRNRSTRFPCLAPTYQGLGRRDLFYPDSLQVLTRYLVSYLGGTKFNDFVAGRF
jgi:hypothetical protein